MIEFYRELKRPGRCMWWGYLNMMTLFLVAWGTGLPQLYGFGCIMMFLSMIGAAAAWMNE